MGECLSLYGPAVSDNYENACYSVGACSMRGCRATMEDRYSICLSFPSHPTYSLVAVFDGFNGHSASEYLSNHLCSTLNKLNTLNDDELIINEINKLDKRFLDSTDEGINTASGSTIVFALIENAMNPMVSGSPSLVTGASSSIPSISTSTCSTMSSSTSKPSFECYPAHKPTTGRIFWIGDSRAILINEYGIGFQPLTIDHHCDSETELIRIKKTNTAQIINNKIDGICSISRCFGCEPMKNNKELKDDQQKMICLAQCKKITIKSEEVLILFSDGLTQKWNNDELVKRFNFHYNQHTNNANPSPKSVNYLIEECIDCGSKDNITMIAIKFQ